MSRSIQRLVGGVAAAATLLVVAACGSDAGEDGGGADTVATGDDLKGKTLNVVSWGGVWTDATKEHFADPFSEDTGAKVEFQVSGTDPTAPVLLQEQQGNVSIDLIDGGNAGRLELEGYLEHFPEDLMTVLEETSRPEEVEEYVLGYGSTATLIVCNPTIVEKCPTNAQEFWDVENFPGERAMAASYYSAMSFALLADGASPDELFPMDAERAIAKLEEIKPHIKVWPDSGSMQQQVMIDKEVGIQFMWNGRAFVVKRDNIPELEFYWDDSVVSSGGGWSVPKDAPDADVAFAFLKWVAEHPENQAAWTEDLSYPTPTKELLDLLPQEIADALPAAHDPAVIPNLELAKQAEELQKAWQSFLTS